MTTASKITLVRVVLIPVYMVLMLLSANGADWLRWAAVAVFVIASISDFLDGYIARHYNQTTDFGKFMDPLADKVLVLAGENQRKLDSLLIDQDIVRKMRGFWERLHAADLIGDKKLNNLMRDRVSDDRLKGFINRQLVETSQIVKQVQQIMRARYADSSVLPIKAGLSSQLRKECEFVKCREINDFHHAHDAFLACRMGMFCLLYTSPSPRD